MALLSVTLAVSPGAWQLFSKRKADPGFLRFSQKVHERDHHTCQFCGFQAQEYQEVVNRDQDYQNNKLSNLVTACCFCTQCFFLDGVGKGEYGGGTLVYLPEISQTELNGFCHVLFCAIANATSYRSDAQSIYRTFKLRSQMVEDEFGEGMSNPSMLGHMLIDAQLKDSKSFQDALLSDCRLLPSRAKFSAQIEAWATAALKEMET